MLRLVIHQWNINPVNSGFFYCTLCVTFLIKNRIIKYITQIHTIMNVLRQTENYELNEGYGMARGLFNISNVEGNAVSDWFGSQVKDELLELSDAEFDICCNSIVQ